MCTVTYIKHKNTDIVLTSNRDEIIQRKTLLPQKRKIGDHFAIYPKDTIAGGTWISMGTNGISCCLLNGAFGPHNRKKQYRKSRGQVLLDVFRFQTIDEFIDKEDLHGIEPFTLVIVDARNGKLLELIWDDVQKHVTTYEPEGAYFWSSAGLYSKIVAAERKKHFEELVQLNKFVDSKMILNLHARSKEDGGFILKTEVGAETLSISQLLLNDEQGTFYYDDLINNEHVEYSQNWELSSLMH